MNVGNQSEFLRINLKFNVKASLGIIVSKMHASRILEQKPSVSFIMPNSLLTTLRIPLKQNNKQGRDHIKFHVSRLKAMFAAQKGTHKLRSQPTTQGKSNVISHSLRPELLLLEFVGH